MSGWFPIGRDESGGWRLDIVALLAVTGESFIGEHAQALTSSKLCLPPRIMPAPHALLQPQRPASLPREIAKFRVLEIRHRTLEVATSNTVTSRKAEGGHAITTGATSDDPEHGNAGPQRLRRRPTMQERAAGFTSNAPTVRTPLSGVSNHAAPARAAFYSPLHLLTILSFFITIGLFTAGALWKDGTALLAVGLASITTTTISYAARWEPIMTGRATGSSQPSGDMIIRTREGAFLVVKCTEEVARELYSGVDECRYVVEDSGYGAGDGKYRSFSPYRLLMTLSAAFLMPSVILLGNCSFNMQALVGAAYLFLNIAYWMIGLLPLSSSWDLSRYEVLDVTPEDARHAYQAVSPQETSIEDVPSFTRTLWFAIRETKATKWVQRSGSTPTSLAWIKWAAEALEAAKRGDRRWPAVSRKDEIMDEFRSEHHLHE
ncbi:hypothetical protein B0I37DRAFT_424138 [Chaetomium sp. MPI-CAGE-AT-0009]|nr:hypothetical protein B0I37DRAFT_424138 [Chaetomium sp. MPI-CAGE-AT-0009]